MPILEGAAAALGAEAALAKGVEATARAVGRTWRDVMFIEQVGENGLQPHHLLRGAALFRPLGEQADRFNDLFELNELDETDWLDVPGDAEAADLEEMEPELAEARDAAPEQGSEREGLEDAEGKARPAEGAALLSARQQRVFSQFLSQRERLTKIERNPGRMARDTAQRIAKIAPTEQAWKAMPPSERLDTMRSCFSIMGEEACLPRGLMDRLEVDMGPLDGNAWCAHFISEISPGRWVSGAESPRIVISEEHLANADYPFLECVSALYHETMHVLQQQCLLEPGDTAPYTELKEEWAEAIRSRENDQDGGQYIDYLSNAMESFAFQQKGIFRLMMDSLI